jgi:hypothetical protein
MQSLLRWADWDVDKVRDDVRAASAASSTNTIMPPDLPG